VRVSGQITRLCCSNE